MIYAKTVLASLVLFQCLILIMRLPACVSKAELGWFFLILVLLGGRSFFWHIISIRGLLSYLLVWSSGNYLAFITAEKRLWRWYLVLPALFVVFSLTGILGFHGTLPYFLFNFFIIMLLSGYPFTLLLKLFKMRHSRRIIVYLIFPALMYLSLGYDFLSRGTGLPVLELSFWLSFLFLAGTGYALTQTSYLAGMSLQSMYNRLGLQEKKLQSTYSRLIQTENTLLLQDRLIVSGILATGAAHEFKNILSSIQICAEFGLSRINAEAGRQSLENILEQASIGRKSVTGFLDKLISQGREQPERILLKDVLKHLLEMARTTYRREGIRLIIELENQSIYARKGELEQVLLNLIRNAADSLRRAKKAGLDERMIRVSSREQEESVVLEVIDNGGGIPRELGNRVFEYSVSEKNSTGLGLYLARMLISRNGGSLDYVPTEGGGSCFRMIFPR